MPKPPSLEWGSFPKKSRAKSEPGNLAVASAYRGRPWRPDELRLKSNEDLHKLWYVLLKEKNIVESRRLMQKKKTGKFPLSSKLPKVRTSMARLLTILSERKKIRENFKRKLENEYVEKKRQEELAKLQGNRSS